MNLLAIVGSPRKGKTTDTLVDKAIESFKSKLPESNVKKINLIDHNIQYCRNCLACRDRETTEAISKCVIEDDMVQISRDVLESDYLIVGTPVHMGFATGILTTFLERICWTFAKPEGKALTLKACPIPRSEKKTKSVYPGF